MSRLEERYRLVLRMLPAAYRQVWEEEMVAAFLESMSADDPEDAEYLADYGRPSWSEVASVAALAVRLRLGGVGAPPRSVAWGQAIRLVALAGLLIHAAVGTAGVGNMLWLTGEISWLPAPPADVALAIPPDLWRTTLGLVELGWLLAYLALLFGNRRAAQLLALLAVVPYVIGAVSTTVDVTRGAQLLVITTWFTLLLDVLVVLALAAFHREAPPVRRRPWMVALAAGIAVMTGLMLLPVVWPPLNRMILLDWPGLYSLALVSAAVAYLAGPVFRRTRRTPAWSLALALLTLAVLAVRVVTLLDYALFISADQRSASITMGIVETVALLAVGLPLAVLAIQALRNRPAPPTPTR